MENKNQSAMQELAIRNKLMRHPEPQNLNGSKELAPYQKQTPEQALHAHLQKGEK